MFAILVLAGLGYGGAKFYLHKKVASGMDNAVLMMSPYADITYKGVSSTMSGKLTVNGINARIKGFNDDLRIDKLGIDTPSFLTLLELGDFASSMQSSNGKLPEYLGFIIEGMHMPVSADYYRRATILVSAHWVRRTSRILPCNAQASTDSPPPRSPISATRSRWCRWRCTCASPAPTIR
jgi:hypothetical protein